jgi:hypothetical protein
MPLAAAFIADAAGRPALPELGMAWYITWGQHVEIMRVTDQQQQQQQQQQGQLKSTVDPSVFLHWT